MQRLSEQQLAELLEPYLQADLLPIGPDTATQTPLARLFPRLASYLDLLLRWNARTNLTSVRDSTAIVQRHFGESLFAARAIARVLQDGDTLLDFGSGAGFPGLPIQMFLPELRVVLAESQRKKAAFLREAIRVTGSPAEIWAQRVEEMPSDRQFGAVTMRAVDNSEAAQEEARRRVRSGGYLIQLSPKSSPIDALTVKAPGSGGHLTFERSA